MIEVERLTKRYKKGKSNAVDDISFSVAEGKFFALLGPNGAGKTTTISVLTTSLLPTSGSVRVAGFDVVEEAASVRQNTGVLFQKPSLDLNLTAEENVRLHSILYGLHPFRPTFSLMPKNYKRRIRQLSELLGIEADLFKPVKRFSGGMQRKLEVVRSLMHRPKVLFLDEPTAGLDAASRRTLWDYLKRVREESNTTIFLTTHYIEEAEEADHICIMNAGKIVVDGNPSDVKSELVEDTLILDSSTEDRAQLCTELDQLGFSYEPSFPIHLSLNGHNVHQLIKGISTPLTTIKINSATLEEAYLELVK